MTCRHETGTPREWKEDFRGDDPRGDDESSYELTASGVSHPSVLYQSVTLAVTLSLEMLGDGVLASSIAAETLFSLPCLASA